VKRSARKKGATAATAQFHYIYLSHCITITPAEKKFVFKKKKTVKVVQ
jgi:hypothetical protein